MYVTVYLLLFAPVVLAAAGPVLTRHLAPAAAVRALTALAVAAAAATVWGLATLAVAGLARVPVVQSVLRSRPRALAAADPVPWGLGPVAAVLLAVVAVRLAVAFRRRGRERAVFAPARSAPAAGDLVVLPGDGADAYALPGRPGRVVVTAGMLRALSVDERAVLLAHERAHLTHRHHLYSAVAQAVVVVNPLLGGLRKEIVFGVERWADEVAAEAVASRRLATRALARAALATTGCVPGPSTGLAYPRHRITARVAALRAGRPESRWRRVLPAAAALAGTLVALADVACALGRCLNALAR